MARVLITGAHGFIGKHLARCMRDSGHEVCGVGHGAWPETEAAVWGVSDWLNADVRADSLRVLQKRFGTPELVFHLAGGSSVGAAIANPHEDFYRTVVTTAELLEWLRVDAPGARLIAVSSAAVYGANHSGTISEAAIVSPYSPYGYHKRLMEELCLSAAATYGQQVTIARLFSVYGVGLNKQLLWDLCSRLLAGADPIVLGGYGDELRDWIDVRDVARALALLSSQAGGRTQVINVGSGFGRPVRSISEAVLQHWTAAGESGAQQRCPELRFSGLARPGDPHSLVADTAVLRSAGFSSEISLARGLSDYVRWFASRREYVQ